MAESDQTSGRGEQLSDDEDIIEFEIEVVSSSASISRTSTPDIEIDIETATTKTCFADKRPDEVEQQQQQQQLESDLVEKQHTEPSQEIQASCEPIELSCDDETNAKEENVIVGGSLIEPDHDKASQSIEHEENTKQSVLVEQAIRFVKEGKRLETPEALGDNFNVHRVETSSVPQGEGSERIPLGDPLRDCVECADEESSATHTDFCDEPQATLAGVSAEVDYDQIDLMEAPQAASECCPQIDLKATKQPDGGPEALDDTQAKNQETGMEKLADEGTERQPQSSNVCESVSATSDPSDGCELGIVKEDVQSLLDCWSVVGASNPAGQSRGTSDNEQVSVGTGVKIDVQGRARSHSEFSTFDYHPVEFNTQPLNVGAQKEPLKDVCEKTISDDVIEDDTTKGLPTTETSEPPPIEQSETAAHDEEGQAAEEEICLELEETPQVEICTRALDDPQANGKTSNYYDSAVETSLEANLNHKFQAEGADEKASAISVDPILDIRQDDMVAIEQRATDRLARKRLSSLSSLPLDNFTNECASLFEDEDLEREFDEEPEFKRREVLVKRNKNPRGEYALGDELGRGKFGTVFRCTEMASGLNLAAKFIHMRRKEDREDVEREVAIMSLLQHKRLLQLYDAFDDGFQEMCLITELVEGGELFERIVDDDFDLTEKKAAIFMRQICEGVDYMHSEQIVHLDMKPENILCLSRTGMRIKLIDFGLARRLDPQKPIRVLFGTPDFAAPEVLAYETVTLATDMWSVGVICYVLLSGLSPFMGDTDMETMANVMRATFDFNDQAFEAISELAKDFISKLLVREPEARLKPGECLKHAWLQRGGAPLDAHIRERRKSSFGLSTQHRIALEQVAMLTTLTEAAPELPDSSAPTPPTPPTAQLANAPSLLANLAKQRGSFGTESTASAGHQSLDKRRLKRYVVRRKWHKTVHAIMALGRMGANLKLV